MEKYIHNLCTCFGLKVNFRIYETATSVWLFQPVLTIFILFLVFYNIFKQFYSHKEFQKLDYFPIFLYFSGYHFFMLSLHVFLKAIFNFHYLVPSRLILGIKYQKNQLRVYTKEPNQVLMGIAFPKFCNEILYFICLITLLSSMNLIELLQSVYFLHFPILL